MTKKIILLFILSSVLIDASAQSRGIINNSELRLQASPVEWNKELPRTNTLCYNSEEASKERSLEPSLYLQPLGDKWEIGDQGNARVFRHEFKVPFTWIDREVFLHIGATSGSYEVNVNGKPIGYSQGKSSVAEFDITRNSKEGINTLEIVVYSDYAASILERHTNSSTPAIVGDVYVKSQPRVRIRDFTTRINFEGDDANVELGVIMKSHLLNEKSYRVFYQLISPTGEQVAHGYRDADFSMLKEDTVRFFAQIPNAYKWSHEAPHLYTLLLKTQHEGRFGEYISHKVGLRTVEMQDGKLLINSRVAPLHISRAIANSEPQVIDQSLNELKASGYNAIKLCEPMQPYFYELCDAKGIYVINQSDICTESSGTSRARMGNPSNDPIWENSYLDRMESMYHTSQNHASVIGFSIADKSANGYNLYVSYLRMKQLERTRPIIYMNADGEWNSDVVDSGIATSCPEVVAQRIVLDVGETSTAINNISPTMELIDRENATYKITNNAILSDLHGEITYVLKQGLKKVSEGSMQFSVKPQSSGEFSLPLGDAKLNKKLKYEIDFKTVLK